MKAQRLSSDRITTLPQTIIETILCLLPIQEAARTSILSKEWRYKWTTILKLEFNRSTVSEKTNIDIDDMTSIRKNMDKMCKLFYAIHQVLLLRQGPIHEFTLSTQACGTCFEIDQIILYLAMNHPVKKLTLDLDGYHLPLSLFSLHQLTGLSLDRCDIKHKPIFNGFGSLTSLSMFNVAISKDSFLHLLSNCPLLKRLSLLASDEVDVDEAPTIMELFKCLPVIEHLTTSHYYVKYGVEVSVPQELPISLPHLKHFCFDEFRFDDHCGLPFLCALIKCSPNVEKIELEMGIDWDDNEFDSSDEEECSNKLEECSDCWFEHLNELKISYFNELQPTMELVKFMLARSPNLKKVILDTWEEDNNIESEMLKILLRTSKSSPAEIIVNNSSLKGIGYDH